MKDLVKRAKSFMTFDYQLQTANISKQFATAHKKLEAENPGWSTSATRQKLIGDYWYTYVAGHFSVMFGLPMLVIFLGRGFGELNFFMLSVLIA
jgi:hypothetical protein